MSLTEPEKICPICGKPNNCQHGQGGCWCDTVKFPKYILDMIPEDKRGKACVCRSCLEKYQRIEIVKLQKSDIKEALDLIWLVFQEFEVPDYSPLGVNTFKGFISYDSIIEKFDKGEMIFWGSFVDKVMTGVIAVRDTSHICTLFVKKEYQRQGIARKLFKTVLNQCKAYEDVKRITVNSSPYAVEVYHRLGFKDLNIEQTEDGIRYTPMEYKL